ncbi:hypothetical protein TRFO_23082 [Tritrichomonas foetus]|uniref:Uncharacterized protein n=1 Tax=Tritrichomonas foetus TaxID=1144522 RepID=A0A1J4KF61_9EUKA|nr:hypothetical protein TRFO_23082 [Tritrichomonas foetus]|eukprot:OHT08404.1 hypothetical protein TRFO_23082 [Tritrichomonas foetus]
MDLSEENFEQVTQFISDSIYLQDLSKQYQLILNILFAVEYRIKATSLLAQLVKFIFSKLDKSEQNKEQLKKLILNRCFSYAYQILDSPQQFRYIFFIFHCLIQEIVTDDDIVKCLSIFSSENDLFNQMALYFSWFAPEIQRASPTFFNYHFAILKERSRAILFPTIFNDNDKNINDYEKDDWKLLKDRRKGGYSPHIIAEIISNDDSDRLQEASTSSSFNINMKIPPSVFETFWILNFSPTLIQYAACKGSINCFRFLLLAQADLSMKDNRRTSIQTFAIFGGNSMIIRIIDQNKFDFKKHLNDSILFHRNLIFNWILETHCKSPNDDIKAKEIIFNAAASNNLTALTLGIEKENNVNYQSKNGETAIFNATKNGALDCFIFLLKNPSINLRGKNKFGDLIQNAIQFRKLEIVQVLLDSPDFFNSNDFNNNDDGCNSHHETNDKHLNDTFNDKNETNNENNRIHMRNSNSYGTVNYDYLHLAIQMGDEDILSCLLKNDLIRMKINESDGDVGSPIIFAAESGREECVKVLLNTPGIDLHLKNSEGKTLVQIAQSNGFSSIAKLLLNI